MVILFGHSYISWKLINWKKNDGSAKTGETKTHQLTLIDETLEKKTPRCHPLSLGLHCEAHPLLAGFHHHLAFWGPGGPGETKGYPGGRTKMNGATQG